MIGFILIIVWVVLWTYLSNLVAADRGANGGLWALIGFLLGPIGFILALATIPKPEGNAKVASAQATSKQPHIPAREAKFCYGCGNRMHITASFCPTCGKQA